MLRKRWLVLVLLFLAALGAALAWRGPEGTVAAVRPADPAPSVAAPAAQVPPRAPLKEAQGEPFAPRSWTPPQPATPAASAPAAPAGPPPMPYRYAGRVLREGVEEILLARGDELVSVREGATLAGGYRVESIGQERIMLRYLPLGAQQAIPRLTLPTDK